MGIAITLQEYLSNNGVEYDCIAHERTGRSIRAAESSHVPAESLAKAVVLRRGDSFILAVLPASRRVEIDEVGGWLRQPVGLASEEELVSLFPDCEPGAVPPIAAAYGLRSLVDESLEAQPDIYFEAGDHCTLVHVSGPQFHKLMEKVPHGHFSKSTENSTKSTNPPKSPLDDELWKYDL